MGNYNNRSGELNTMLAALITASEAEGGSEGATERNQASARIAEYISARDRALAELVEAAKSICSGSSNADTIWRRPVDSLAESAARILGGLTSGITNPGKAAQAFAWQVQSQEARFVAILQGMDLLGRWAGMEKLRVDVEGTNAALQAKWRALAEKSASLDYNQDAMAVQLKQALVGARATAEARSRATSERLKVVSGELALLSNDSSRADWHEDTTDAMQSVFSMASQVYRELDADSAALMAAAAAARNAVQALRGMQDAEIGAIHRLFLDARAEAAQFCRQSASDLAEAMLQECRSILTNAATSLPTSAQQADAQAMASDILAWTEPLKASIQKAFEALKSEHAGRFLGDLNSATTEALAHSGAWAGRRGWESEVLRGLGDARAQAESHWQFRVDEPCQKLAATIQARLDGAERITAEAADKRRARDERFAGARTELFQYLPTDADLDAFVVDFYSSVQSQFWQGITRAEKMNILLEAIGADTVLKKAREHYERINPFTADDLPTRRNEYAVNVADRESLLATLGTGADFEAFALDHFARAYNEFTSTMTRRQRAALLLSHFPASEVLAKAKDYYGKLHPFDARNMPTRPGRYPATVEDRDRLVTLLQTDADFEAFALDYFKHAFDDFGSGMDRQQKAGLILAYYGASAVFAKLKEHLDARDKRS